MVIESILEYRTGNFVNYRGQGAPYELCLIESIDTRAANGSLYRLSYAKMQGPLICRVRDLSPITLEPIHLEKLGFILNPHTGIFSLINLDISYHKTTYTNEGGMLTLGLPVPRIFKPFTPVPQRKVELVQETILANTVDIPTVHSFQNYCSDRGIALDFSVVTQLASF